MMLGNEMDRKGMESSVPNVPGDAASRKRKSTTTDASLQSALDVLNEGLKWGRKNIPLGEFVVVSMVLMLDSNLIACKLLLELLGDNRKSAGEEYGGRDVRTVMLSTFGVEVNNAMRSMAETNVTIWCPPSDVADPYLRASLGLVRFAWGTVTSSLALRNRASGSGKKKTADLEKLPDGTEVSRGIRSSYTNRTGFSVWSGYLERAWNQCESLLAEVEEKNKLLAEKDEISAAFEHDAALFKELQRAPGSVMTRAQRNDPAREVILSVLLLFKIYCRR
jgi:hypothetical protein